MTAKLYQDDPYIQTFAARVLSIAGSADGTCRVELDRTAFYPTGGGQPHDTGTIAGMAVIDVEEQDGRIWHRLDATLQAAVGAEVECAIDWERRFDHMQQHTGQHILSAIFDDGYNAPTVAFHLGRDAVTIDIAISQLDNETAQAAEQAANAVIRENRFVQARFVTNEELAAMPLRKPPTVTEQIRIVEIDRFDYNPCGGTHPQRTGEVGLIKILGWEKAKGNIRVEFVCGNRALAAFEQKQRIIKDLMKQLASQEADLPQQIARLLQEKKELEHRVQSLATQLLQHEAENLAKESETSGSFLLLTRIFDQRPIHELQKLSRLIADMLPKAIVLFASEGDKLQLVFARGADVPFAMNGLLKETLLLIDGKGGGTADLAQGGGSPVCSAAELIRYARNQVENGKE